MSKIADLDLTIKAARQIHDKPDGFCLRKKLTESWSEFLIKESVHFLMFHRMWSDADILKNGLEFAERGIKKEVIKEVKNRKYKCKPTYYLADTRRENNIKKV